MKTCKGCGLEKSETEFNAAKNLKGGLRSKCKACLAQYRREWRKANGDADRARRRQYHHRRRITSPDTYKAREHRWLSRHPERRREVRRQSLYGLTPDAFAAMFADQGGKCAMCRGDFTGKGPMIDHDHNTEEVRGLLCVRCNSGLGVYEKPGFLTAAAAYLSRPKLKLVAS